MEVGREKSWRERVKVERRREGVKGVEVGVR